MSEFLTELQAKLITEDPELWELTAPLSYYSERAARVITAPTGFQTNFASVPRAPLAYWLCGGIGDRAAALHDYLYSTGMFSREMCDAIYREALLTCGVTVWRAWLMWSMVRMFGDDRYGEKEVAA